MVGRTLHPDRESINVEAFLLQVVVVGLLLYVVAKIVPGITVDGNDMIAVYAATLAAAQRARSGGGPTLIEAKTYRYYAHTSDDDDKAYRSLTLSWFRNSPLLELVQEAQEIGLQLIITTDHGTINVQQPSKVIGDRETSLNLRYKTGKSLTYESREVIECKRPADFHLPSIHVSSSFIFVRWGE